MSARIASLALFLLLASCAGHRHDPARSAPERAWRREASEADRARLSGWRDAMQTALAAARKSGHGRAIDAEGALLQPDAALADPSPPVGNYRCRVTKLGASRPGLLDYIAYPAFLCMVSEDKDGLRLTKIGGSQRPAGRLLPDDPRHLVFLGTIALGDETGWQPYGRDAERDMIGRFERVGPQRWRLLLPSQRWESLTDVMELVPA